MALLSIGLGIALEVSERRQANKARKNLQAGQLSQHDSQGLMMDNSQAQLDERAFQEVQNYADFQKMLSERVNDDIIREEAHPALTYTPTTPTFKHSPSLQPYLDRALFASISQRILPSPVVIPQRRSENGKMAWTRAYAPVFWQCGISQEEFFKFIDSYNQIIENTPNIEVVNLRALGGGRQSSMAHILSSAAVPMAVGIAKGSQSEEPSSTFLRQANNTLFTPRGVYAMVGTFSRRESQIYTVNNSQSTPISPSRRASETQIQFATPILASEIEAPQGSPKRVRGHKGDVKKPLRRPTSSRRRMAPRNDGLMGNGFNEAVINRVRGRRQTLGNAMRAMVGRSDDTESTQPYESDDIDDNAIYLLIVNNPVEAAASPTPPHNQNSVWQLGTSHRPWVYAPDYKRYSNATFGGPENVSAPPRADQPPNYDILMNGGYNKGQVDYCIPTL